MIILSAIRGNLVVPESSSPNSVRSHSKFGQLFLVFLQTCPKLYQVWTAFQSFHLNLSEVANASSQELLIIFALSYFYKQKKNSHYSCSFVCPAASYSHRGKPPTTIGAEKLNFRVRYGNGCDLLAIATRLFD